MYWFRSATQPEHSVHTHTHRNTHRLLRFLFHKLCLLTGAFALWLSLFFGVHIWIYISYNGLREQRIIALYSLCDYLSPWNRRAENFRLDKDISLSIFINILMSNNTKSHDPHISFCFEMPKQTNFTEPYQETDNSKFWMASELTAIDFFFNKILSRTPVSNLFNEFIVEIRHLFLSLCLLKFYKSIEWPRSIFVNFSNFIRL